MSIFKAKEPVYVYPDGWGEVLEVQNDLVKIDFGDRYAYHKSYEVSFTKYDLVRGGFSQKRPEQKLEVGKSYRNIINKNVVVINRKANNSNYGLNIDGSWFDDIYCSSADEWQEIPKSEAIALLEKECVKWGGEDWRDVKIRECLKYGKQFVNQNRYIIQVGTSKIFNNNGCIFNNGKWAEKLDEPEIKEGQMIWVRDHNGAWIYARLLNLKNGKAITRNIMGGTFSWDQYSLTNPYPDSIEARAVELLRRLNGTLTLRKVNDLINDIEAFLTEIDSYEKK